MFTPKYGPGNSLAQVNAVGGKLDAAQAVVAGMICHTDATTGVVTKGLAATGQVGGFAINSYTDSNVQEAGVISLYLLDGSVISSDQSSITINSTNYALGANVYPTTGGTGTFTNVNTVNRIIGQVEGIRILPADKNTVTSGFYHSVPITVLDIKLAAL